MNEQERLYVILAEAILHARNNGTDQTKSAEAAAKAFRAGIAAYSPKPAAMAQAGMNNAALGGVLGGALNQFRPDLRGQGIQCQCCKAIG